jgi:hypothetical protein
MFDLSDQRYPGFAESPDDAYEGHCRIDIPRAAGQRADNANQKIFLPPGSSQSRFAPPSYYYLASKSGGTPSWVIDELNRGRSLNLNS